MLVFTSIKVFEYKAKCISAFIFQLTEVEMYLNLNKHVVKHIEAGNEAVLVSNPHKSENVFSKPQCIFNTVQAFTQALYVFHLTPQALSTA